MPGTGLDNSAFYDSMKIAVCPWSTIFLVVLQTRSWELKTQLYCEDVTISQISTSLFDRCRVGRHEATSCF